MTEERNNSSALEVFIAFRKLIAHLGRRTG